MNHIFSNQSHRTSASTHAYFYLGFWQIPDGGQPHGVSQSASGGFWVCDARNHRVLKLDMNGRIERKIGMFGHQPGCFNHPCAIFERQHHIYVCEYFNHRIQKISLDSGPIEILSNYSYPFNILNFCQTHLIVAEKTSSHISAVSYITKERKTLFRMPNNDLMLPYGIDFLLDNTTIIFANDENISCFDIHGYPLLTITGYPLEKIDLLHIDYIASNDNGDIYLLDRINRRINIISPDNSIIYINLENIVLSPEMMLSKNDILIVTDNKAGRIHFFLLKA